MPLPRRFLLGLLFSLCVFPAGCGKRAEPPALPIVEAEVAPAAPKPVEEDVGPNRQTIDLRVAGIWAKIDLPEKMTLTSAGRDECLLRCGSSFAISVNRSTETAETAKERLTAAGWKLAEQTDAGFVAEIESPEPARVSWRFFNPYPAGYVVSIVPSAKLTSEQRQRVFESIKTFRPIAVTVEEMTRSQQAMADLRLAGATIIARSGGLEVDFPWRANTEKMLLRITELNRVATVRVTGSGAFTGNHLKQVSGCTGLTSLHLQNLVIADADWSGLDGRNSLQEIRIEQAPHRPLISAASSKNLLDRLGRLPAMRSVFLRRYACDTAVLKLANQLAKPRLATIGFEDAGITGPEVKILAEYSGWKGLSLSDNPITPDGLASLRELKGLERLDLSGCRINDRSMTYFGELPLRDLNISRTEVTDAGIAALLKMFPNLSSLDVSATAGTDACLASLAKLTKLRDLSLAHLALKAPAVDQLKVCAELRSLNLANTSIKPADLPKLAESLVRLEALDLRATATDADSADKIVKARPECQLLFAGTPAEEGRRVELVIPAPTSVVLPVPADQLAPADPVAMLNRYDGKMVKDEEAETKPVVEITISSVDITDLDLAELRGLKTLERLRLDGCEKITEAGLAYLKDIISLKQLYLSRTAVTANASSVLGQFKRLAVLELPDVTMSQKHLSQLEALKDLESLRGVSVPNHPEAFVEFLAKCKKLRQFDWQAVEWNNRRLGKLKDLAALETLEIRGNWVADAGIELAANFPALRELTIHDDLISDAGLKPLEKLTGLRKLRLEGRRFSDNMLVPFRNNEGLESLRFACPGFTDRGAVPMRSFGKLLELDLHANNIGDATLQQIGELKDLEWIDLSDTKVTDAGLKFFKNMEELRKLTLSRTAITGEGFEAIDKLPRLARLELDHTKLTKKGVQAISNVFSVEELDLAHVQVGDDAILCLKTLPVLQTLRLDANVAMTDKTADGLVTFPQLAEVSVIGTKLTGKGLAVLRKKDGLNVLTE